MGWVGLTAGDVIDEALGSPLGEMAGGWIFPTTGYLMWLLGALGLLAGVLVGAVLPRVLRKRRPRFGLAFLGAFAGTGVAVAVCWLGGRGILHPIWFAAPVFAGLAAELEVESSFEAR